MRAASHSDFPAIERALRRLLAMSTSAKMKNISEQAALEYVFRAIQEKRVILTHGCMFMYDIGREWFQGRDFMIEELFMKMEKCADIASAIDDLLLLGEAHKMDIVVGDTQIGLMTPYYHAAGFQTIGTQLLRSKNDGSNP